MALNELVLKFRDKVIGSDGAIQANVGDKIFLRLILDQRQAISEENFYIWIKAKIKGVFHNAVSVDEVELVNKFDDDKKQKIVEENYDSFKSRFRGTKTITLKKDGNWLVVPSGQTSGISSISSQEQISIELGLQEADVESLVEEQEQEMQEPEKLDVAIMFNVMHITIFLEGDRTKHITEIIKALFADQTLKAVSSKQLMTLLQAKMPADKDTEQMLYAINIMQEVMGISLIPNKGSKQFFETHWKSME